MISEQALSILRRADKLDRAPNGVCWITGPIVEELRGLLTIETVTNPDGSPGGGAYYYGLTDKGKAALADEPAELLINGRPCSWGAFVDANVPRPGGLTLIEAVRKLAVGETHHVYVGTPSQSMITVLVAAKGGLS